MSTWGKCFKPLVWILNIQYQPTSGDEYGGCHSSAMSILGRTVLVEVVREASSDGQEEINLTVHDSNEVRDFLTVTSPFELSDKDLKTSTLLALRFAWLDALNVHAIILKLVSDSSNKFQRLGIAECPNDWFAGRPLNNVTMI